MLLAVLLLAVAPALGLSGHEAATDLSANLPDDPAVNAGYELLTAENNLAVEAEKNATNIRMSNSTTFQNARALETTARSNVDATALTREFNDMAAKENSEAPAGDGIGEGDACAQSRTGRAAMAAPCGHSRADDVRLHSSNVPKSTGMS